MNAAADRTGADAPLVCARCAAALQPGAGDFFRVTIEAVADPWPPLLSAAMPAEDIRKRIEILLAQLADLSEQDAMDQVYRRLTLHLCGSCCRVWIADPIAGAKAQG